MQGLNLSVGGQTKRRLDDDGSLATRLNALEHSGDPDNEGIVWPRIAEIGLLCGLGCGSWLLQLVLEELQESKQFDFAVLQASLNSVLFYEKMGFVRVGAVARYAQKGQNIAKVDTVGYRHWTFAAEDSLDSHGGPSYMMCLDLKAWKRLTGKKLGVLAKVHIGGWPEIQCVAGAPELRQLLLPIREAPGSPRLAGGSPGLGSAGPRLQMKYEVACPGYSLSHRI